MGNGNECVMDNGNDHPPVYHPDMKNTNPTISGLML